jgi:hypothetical protein
MATYIRIDGHEVMGLTDGERRSLHPSWLGRKPTWDDVRDILGSTLLGPVVHHMHVRSRCDGCTTRVYDWAEELSQHNGITGRRFCSTCARWRTGGMQWPSSKPT